jgi:hypothetical protein
LIFLQLLSIRYVDCQDTDICPDTVGGDRVEARTPNMKVPGIIDRLANDLLIVNRLTGLEHALVWRENDGRSPRTPMAQARCPCGLPTLRADPDKVTDNNLDDLPGC